MSLSPAFLDELRARTRVSQVIGQDVKLIRAGKEFKTCCPFHNEKTPSFYINDEKQFYHCFGCGAHGDAIRYLTDARGLGFMDAVKELAGKAGMEVPAPDPRAQERAERRASLVDVTEAAADWYREQLGGIEGANARAYIQKRGLSAATIDKFGIGFAPDAKGKLKAALDRFGNEKLIESGMLIQPEDRDPYDRFRGRLMIPIRDPRGRTIAFGGRIIGDGEPKYLNSPETPLFDKGRQLYNLDLAAPASRQTDRIIVVEGYMDVIALDQAGIGEAVAPLGTALTESQLQNLWRIHHSPILCFDGDTAGQKAAERALARALPMMTADRSVQFVSLPSGMDPDDVVSAGGAELFNKALETAKRYDEYLWTVCAAKIDPTSPAGRTKLLDSLKEYSFSIEDRTLAGQTWNELRERFYSKFGFRRSNLKEISELASATPAAKSLDLHSAFVKAVLWGLTRYPEIAAEHSEFVLGINIDNSQYDRWRHILLDSVIEKPEIDENGLESIVLNQWPNKPKNRDLSKDLAFSFFYKSGDKAKAKEDLRRVIMVLYAESQFSSDAAEQDSEFQDAVSEETWAEMQRLRNSEEARKEELSRFAESVAA